MRSIKLGESKKFGTCPRFKAYQDDLKARGLEKEED
jgi:hypothetical protein